WKRRIKARLLGNFKHAYVDVLSRQQSAFNRHILAAVQELSECYAMLDHALQTMTPNEQQTPRDESTALLKCQEGTPLARWVESCLASGRVDDVALFLQELLKERRQDRERLASLEARLEWLERSEERRV